MIATTLVRPSKNITEVKLSSIRKKWKNSRFAAGVDRDHVQAVTADFGRLNVLTDRWICGRCTHIQNVLTAMQAADGSVGVGRPFASIES